MRSIPGLLRHQSPYPVAETLDRLVGVLREHGVAVFARIDHAGEAGKVGLVLRPTEVLVFGNPRAGTPVMQAEQTAAIALPLRALAWEDAEGQVWLGIDDSQLLGERFGVPAALLAPLGAVTPLIEAALR